MGVFILKSVQNTEVQAEVCQELCEHQVEPHLPEGGPGIPPPGDCHPQSIPHSELRQYGSGHIGTLIGGIWSVAPQGAPAALSSLNIPPGAVPATRVDYSNDHLQCVAWVPKCSGYSILTGTPQTWPYIWLPCSPLASVSPTPSLYIELSAPFQCALFPLQKPKRPAHGLCAGDSSECEV